jgi:hypothetical protein
MHKIIINAITIIKNREECSYNAKILCSKAPIEIYKTICLAIKKPSLSMPRYCIDNNSSVPTKLSPNFLAETKIGTPTELIDVP